MPYCPKCDMEFIDGITNCTDCGGPLCESKEAADAIRRSEQLAAQEDLYAGEDLSDFDKDIKNLSEAPVLPHESIKKAAESRAYVTKRQRYDDMRSSISAFLSIGVIFLAFGLLCWVGIIELPLAAGALLVFKVVLTGMGIGCLIVAVVTKNSAAAMLKAADIEDVRTKEVITWFVDTYNAKQMDEELLREDPALEGNELYLQRFELIQDHLITEQDLPDQDYVDFLCEEIYGRVFEK